MQHHPDSYGRLVAAHLDAGAGQLPHEVTERLRAARVRALAKRKREAWAPVRRPAFAGAGRLVDEGITLWDRLASALPVLMLAAGLIVIHGVQNELRAHELAEVDAALLTDDLPPAAYADPGFARFLQLAD